MPYLMQEDIPK